MGDGGWLDLIFFMHMVLTIGSVLLLPLVAYVETEEALLALSEQDPLTGVLNRRGLFRHGEGGYAWPDALRGGPGHRSLQAGQRPVWSRLRG